MRAGLPEPVSPDKLRLGSVSSWTQCLECICTISSQIQALIILTTPPSHAVTRPLPSHSP